MAITVQARCTDMPPTGRSTQAPRLATRPVRQAPASARSACHCAPSHQPARHRYHRALPMGCEAARTLPPIWAPARLSGIPPTPRGKGCSAFCLWSVGWSGHVALAARIAGRRPAPRITTTADSRGSVGRSLINAVSIMHAGQGSARLVHGDTRRLGARPRHRTDIPPSASSAGHRSRPSRSTGTHPPQRGAGTHGAAALAVTGPPLSRWTQPRACRFAWYWLRAATRASPAASTTSVDDARTATLRPGSSTSSSTSPTASLPGPTE